jgi:phosphate:Na+ symporter
LPPQAVRLRGFALVLYGLTTLQQGMGGVAEQLHPSDLPAVLGAPDVSFLRGSLGLLSLVVVGLIMTAVMQSSTAAIAVTLSAFYAGAVGLDQGCALIIGQNIGTATSSALASIGASTTAKRLAVAYILFKVIAALIALVLFPLTVALMARAPTEMDGVTLLAAYHTAYNVVGVAILMPVIDRFTHFVERLLPETRSPLLRGLDPAALENPVVAVESMRRTIARAVEKICAALEAALCVDAKPGGTLIFESTAVLRQAREFISEMASPPQSKSEEQRLTSALHALDHASRLAEVAGEAREFTTTKNGPDETRATALCSEAMRAAILAVKDIAHERALSGAAEPIQTLTPGASAALAKIEANAKALADLRRAHRGPTLSKVGAREITADEAMVRIEEMQRYEALAHHAWRASVHLNGQS